jgi:hypothetical protein
MQERFDLGLAVPLWVLRQVGDKGPTGNFFHLGKDCAVNCRNKPVDPS